MFASNNQSTDQSIRVHRAQEHHEPPAIHRSHHRQRRPLYRSRANGPWHSLPHSVPLSTTPSIKSKEVYMWSRVVWSPTRAGSLTAVAVFLSSIQQSIHQSIHQLQMEPNLVNERMVTLLAESGRGWAVNDSDWIVKW